MELLSLSFLSLNTFLKEFFHFDLLLFFKILWIFHEMKANSSSSDLSLDSSLKQISTLRAWDEPLNADFEDVSLDNEAFLVFWTLSARDLFFLSPLSCCSSCS